MAEGDFPDTEAGIVALLKNYSQVTNIVGTSVLFGVPRNNPSFPLIVVRRLTGGEDTSDAPLDQAVLNIDCWGRSKLEASNLVNAVRSVFFGVRSPVEIAGVRIYVATVDSVVWQPDPEDDRPRYVLTTRVTSAAV